MALLAVHEFSDHFLWGSSLVEDLIGCLGNGHLHPHGGRQLTGGVHGVVALHHCTDGLDGLNSSVTLVVCLGFSVISMMLEMKGLSLLAAAMVGALIGFLFWNANPAKVFGSAPSATPNRVVSANPRVIKEDIVLWP